MNDKQLEIFKHNMLQMSKTIQCVGGCVGGILKDNIKFLETMSRNGVRLNPTIENVD